jgi:uncharacterized protein YuzE
MTRFRYDPESGALYFRLREGAIEETLELPSPGGYLDVSAEGTVLGIEFLSIPEFVTFLRGFGGEVEVPEHLDAGAYDEFLHRALRGSLAMSEKSETTSGEAVSFFRETFRPSNATAIRPRRS